MADSTLNDDLGIGNISKIKRELINFPIPGLNS